MAQLFRAPTSVAAASGGPSWLPTVFVVLAIVVGSQFVTLRGCGISPPNPTPPANGPNLVEAFKTNDNRVEARAHAHLFATICSSVAEYLEYDGTRPTPLITTGVQIDDFRRGLRQTRTKGQSFLPKYPGLEKELETFLTSAVGTSGGPFDAPQRAKWVAAMRQVAVSAEYAAK
jgi:hypothetical protein